jgi:multidrug efflux pump subunit AcrB
MLRVSSRKVVLATVATSILIGGCAKSPPPTVKLTVDYPGASAKVVDDVVGAPIWEQILGAEGLLSLICVSSKGRVEVYAHGSPGLDATAFAHDVERRARLAVPVFPGGVRLGKVDDVSGSPFPPVVHIRDVDKVKLLFDRKKLLSLGVSLRDALEAINKDNEVAGYQDAAGIRFLAETPATADSVKRLKDLNVKSPDGRNHRLEDFAEIKLVREPDHLIRRWP